MKNELVILDYSTGSVHFYKCKEDISINEDYIKKLGFNPSSCSWMFTDDIAVYKYKGELK